MKEADKKQARRRIAFVNQRYGLEVNGGSEYYTRLIAEHLTRDYDVEVLTSKALSYDSWKNYYTEEVEQVNGVTVRRFTVRRKRNRIVMRLTEWLIRGKAHLNKKNLCDCWVQAQGPRVPGLIDYIHSHKEDYAVIFFVTYLYYPTVFGLPEAKEKAILIPTAHDEPFIHFRSHAPLFTMPKAIIYLSDEEKALVHSLYHNEWIPSVIAGVGVDTPEQVNNTGFREKYGIWGDYLIYTGRVDVGKGCDRMMEYFLRYMQEREHRENLTLVIMGQQFMEIPEDKHIRYLGFVSEEDKFNGVAGAKALWLSSSFESLSISVLEAMALDVPVLVNGKCQVLRGHCEKSRGGLYYTDYTTCRKALDRILGDQQFQKALGKNAGVYVRKCYSWDQIIKKMEGLIETVADGSC